MRQTGFGNALMIELLTEEIEREEMVAIDLGPVVTEIDHGADVRVTAIDCTTTGLARTAFAVVVTR